MPLLSCCGTGCEIRETVEGHQYHVRRVMQRQKRYIPPKAAMQVAGSTRRRSAPRSEQGGWSAAVAAGNARARGMRTYAPTPDIAGIACVLLSREREGAPATTPAEWYGARRDGVA